MNVAPRLEFARHAITTGEGLYDHPDEHGFPLRAVLAKAWRGRWLVLAATVVGLVLALVQVAQLRPSYTAAAKVMFDAYETNIVDLDAAQARPVAGGARLRNQIEILTSAGLIDKVVAELGLDRVREFNPSLGGRGDGGLLAAILARGRSLAWGVLADLGILAPPEAPSGEASARRTQVMVRGAVLDAIRLEPIPDSGVIRIAATTASAKLSAAIANEVARQYVTAQLDAKLEATRQATLWLSERVEELRERVETAEAAVEAYRAEMTARTGQSAEVIDRQLKQAAVELSAARSERSAAGIRYRRVLSEVRGAGNGGSAAELQRSPLIQRYRQQEAALLSKEAALAATVGDGHERLRELRGRIAHVRANIAAEAERIVESLKSEFDIARAREERLSADVRALEALSLEQNRAEVRLHQLEREAGASRIIFENFLGRLKQTSGQEELQRADAVVLSTAEPPVAPDGSARNRILASGGLLGFAAGLGLVFLLDKLRNTFRGADEVHRITGLPVLAAIPSAGRRRTPRDLLHHVRRRPTSALAEAVRNLRTSLLFGHLDHSPAVVMLTSTVAGEGKSTSSMLLALASAEMGRSAILVDCDLRISSLAALAGTDRPGLLAMIEGSAPFEEAVHVDPDSGLHVLVARPHDAAPASNAADILASRRFRQLIAALRERYDLVLLDTPPVLSVADARIVAGLADAVLYAVRWDATPRGAVREGLRELAAVEAPLAGIVLTMVDERRASGAADGYYRGTYADLRPD